MRRSPLHIGVVGAGIAGLSSAIALRKAGFGVRVFEKRARPDAGGGALLLWPNGFGALDRLGLGERVSRGGTPIDRLEFRDTAGGTLACWPLPIPQSRGTRLVLRADLVRALREAVPDSVLDLGAAVSGFHATDEGVRLELDAGGRPRFDALVGCDGIHSRIRSALFGSGVPAPVRHLVFMAIVEHDDLESVPKGVALTMVGHGRRFCTARIDSERVFWYATVNASSAPPPDADESGVFGSFTAWRGPAAELIERRNGERIRPVVVTDAPLLHRWGRGRVTLLGDAAHASMPDIAQGAGQALESSVALGDCLATGPSVEAALRAYEQRRRSQTAQVTYAARMVSRWGMSESAHMKAFRNAAARHVLPVIGFPMVGRIARVMS